MSDLHQPARKVSQAAGLRFHIAQWGTYTALAAASHPSKRLRASQRTFVMNYGVTHRVLVSQGKARESVSSVKLSHRAAAARVCMPFWRLNIFMVPLAQELFSCWKSGRNSPIQMVKKNNFSWANPKTKAFLKQKTDRRVGGREGEQPLILNKHCRSLLGLILFARA